MITSSSSALPLLSLTIVHMYFDDNYISNDEYNDNDSDNSNYYVSN